MSKPTKPTPPAFHLPGQFIRTTFKREYKKTGFSESEADIKFEALLKSGEVVKIREWNNVSIFEMKKQTPCQTNTK